MSELQLRMRKQVERKISDGIYLFEKVPCCICQGNDFMMLAEKERHGLSMSTQICQQCGLVQTNPRMTQQSYIEFYIAEYRALYEDFNPRELFVEEYNNGKRIYEDLNKFLVKDVSKPFVFEVGCAAGGLLQYFKEKGCEVAGLDVSGVALEFGRKTYGLNLQIGTLADMRFEKPPDLILYCDVFEHLLDPIHELQSLSSVINNDTIVYIEVPGIKDLSHSYNGDFLLMLQNAHTYHFTQTTLENLFKKAGYYPVYSDERVACLYKKQPAIATNKPSNYTSDFTNVLAYLEEIERRHSSPTAKQLSRAIVVKALKWLGLYRLVRGTYQRLKRRGYFR